MTPAVATAYNPYDTDRGAGREQDAPSPFLGHGVRVAASVQRETLGGRQRERTERVTALASSTASWAGARPQGRGGGWPERARLARDGVGRAGRKRERFARHGPRKAPGER